MMLCLTFMALTTIFILIISLLYLIISKKHFLDREKNSPFECGFDPKSSARLPFSTHFFFISIIFLVFDVEIILLLPSILILHMSNLLIWTSTMMFFISILLLGIYHEWFNGYLQWSL